MIRIRLNRLHKEQTSRFPRAAFFVFIRESAAVIGDIVGKEEVISMALTAEERIQLHGFNNLTKTLSFNMYDICFTKTKEEREAYIAYIDEQ